jgi:septal ring factor EnvC (AmiA/AmiB activator)
MEDAPQEAYMYCHGRRFEAMQENRYRFLSRYDHTERTWAVLAPSVTDPTMDTTVRHLCAMQEANEALKEELRAAQKSEKHLQKQIDDLATQLGSPPSIRRRIGSSSWFIEPHRCLAAR